MLFFRTVFYRPLSPTADTPADTRVAACGMASAISACIAVPVGSDRRFSHPGPRSLRRRPLPRWTSVKASAAAGASRTGERKEAEEILADFLRDTAGEHFDEVPAGSLDDVLATWDHPDAADAGALVGMIRTASGLDDEADDPPGKGGGRGGRGGPSPSASARGRAAGMFNVALSALDLRGGAQDAARDLVLNRMPKIGVKPDVVSYSLAIAACFHARSDADDLILAARRAAGADKRSNAKKPKRAKKKKGKGGEVNAGEGDSSLDSLVRTLWQDEHFAVVSKPAGMLTHPNETSGGAVRTLVEVLVDTFGDEGLSAINGLDARGIVHRLDKPTSGALLVAKTDLAHALCVAAWYQRKVTKTYLALVEGVPGRRRGRRGGDEGGDATEGTCDAPADGRPARSDWRVRETFGDGDGVCSLVEVTPRTGRKHQIRQHMGVALDAPLVGDPLYRRGKKPNTPAAAVPLLAGKPGSVIFLHAAALELRHPVTDEALRFSDPLPEAFEGLVSALRG